jgi:hypothetical protein
MNYRGQLLCGVIPPQRLLLASERIDVIDVFHMEKPSYGSTEEG